MLAVLSSFNLDLITTNRLQLMLLTSPFKAAFALLIVSVSLHAAEVNLPQATIDKINQDFLDRYQVNLDCSKGVAFPKVQLFAASRNVYMKRDSNSTLGFSVAELKEVEAGEYYHEEGLRFFTSNLANMSDFFVSSETLAKGEGELTVILYRDIYKCDAKLGTWAVERAIGDVKREKDALLNLEKRGAEAETIKGEFMRLIEQAVHKSVVASFIPPVGVKDDVRVTYKMVIRQSDGVVASLAPIELSQSVDFNAKAAEAFKSLQKLEQLKFDERAMEKLFDRATAADLDMEDVFGSKVEDIVVYIELNSSGSFVPVPENLRR